MRRSGNESRNVRALRLAPCRNTPASCESPDPRSANQILDFGGELRNPARIDEAMIGRTHLEAESSESILTSVKRFQHYTVKIRNVPHGGCAACS